MKDELRLKNMSLDNPKEPSDKVQQGLRKDRLDVLMESLMDTRLLLGSSSLNRRKHLSFVNWVLRAAAVTITPEDEKSSQRPPLNAEFVLYLLLRKEERDVVIGDLIECYDQILRRFDKRHADIWFYKQVIGSLFPLIRRALLRIGALVWVGQILRRLISY